MWPHDVRSVLNGTTPKNQLRNKGPKSYHADHFYSIKIALLIIQQDLELEEYPLHNLMVEKLLSK